MTVPQTDWTACASAGMEVRPAMPGTEPANGSPSGAGTPPRPGLPGAEPPGEAAPAGAMWAPDDPEFCAGATMLAAGEDGVRCAAGAAEAGPPDGDCGMRTDPALAHPLTHVPPPGDGGALLTEVSGVTASVPPTRADAAAPSRATLMT